MNRDMIELLWTGEINPNELLNNKEYNCIYMQMQSQAEQILSTINGDEAPLFEEFYEICKKVISKAELEGFRIGMHLGIGLCK
ncbi:MAG: hypothetical protein NC397_03505 [Clostridium sp.]|nr:hypothetical protein [Clostridium sp.]